MDPVGLQVQSGISLGSCWVTAAIFSADFDMCSCVVTVAAAAQDTAEGAVVTAAGVAAAILSEAAGAVRDITGELLSDAATI
jgi:hypothetical protein